MICMDLECLPRHCWIGMALLCLATMPAVAWSVILRARVVSFLQSVFLIAIGLWQICHLKAFFLVKKLV